MNPYTIAYGAAWAIGAIGVLSGVLAGSAVTPVHPNWLTPDIAATAGLVAAGCIGLESLLPQIQRTPAIREQTYLRALAGVLPHDIAAKYPEDPPVPAPPPASHIPPGAT